MEINLFVYRVNPVSRNTNEEREQFKDVGAWFWSKGKRVWGGDGGEGGAAHFGRGKLYILQ